VTLSTCEAEYYKETEPGKEGIPLARILFEIENGIAYYDEIQLRTVKALLDNDSAINVAKHYPSMTLATFQRLLNEFYF
jgi:hypothetical protein